MTTIAVIGTGYVGSVTAACLAWLGHDVVGFDVDQARVDRLSAGQLPFYEAGLSEIVVEALTAHRLTFTSSPEVALRDAEGVFLCVGTPSGAGGLPDLSQVEDAVRYVAASIREGSVVMNKSTVPVGCGNWVRTMLEESLPRQGGPNFSVVSNPEFLRQGSAVRDFLYPDRIVLGGENGVPDMVSKIYEPILRQDFVGGQEGLRPRLIVTDLASAELIKYAANAFLATKISFANEVANLCELVGADARNVLPAIGADRRIGPQFLDAGVGWGGSCFGKDVAALIAMGLDYGYDSALLRATVDVNEAQRAGVLHKLQRVLKVLKGRRVALLGLSFKPGTDDLRDAPSLEIADRLVSRGALVSAYDPVVKNLPDNLWVRLGADPYDAADRADAVVLLTEWEEFRDLDYAHLAEAMRGNIVLDGRNAVDTCAAEEAHLQVMGTGW